MLVESPIKNIFHGDTVAAISILSGADSETDACGVTSVDGHAIDWLDLNWMECRNRFARKLTRCGREVRLLLRLKQHLGHGDLLGYWPDGMAVVVNLLPSDLWVIRPATQMDWLKLMYQIGNLHVPVEISGLELVVPCLAETEITLVACGVAFELDRRRFQPTHWPALVQLSSDFEVISRPRPDVESVRREETI